MRLLLAVLALILAATLVGWLLVRAADVDADPVRVVTVAPITAAELDRMFPVPATTSTTTTTSPPRVVKPARNQPRTTAPIVRRPRAWTWDELAQCESGGNWSDTRNGYQGGVHFHPTTWDRYRTRWLNDPTLPVDAHLATREQQIRVAEKVLEMEGPGAWPICSYRVGMR